MSKDWERWFASFCLTNCLSYVSHAFLSCARYAWTTSSRLYGKCVVASRWKRFASTPSGTKTLATSQPNGCSQTTNTWNSVLIRQSRPEQQHDGKFKFCYILLYGNLINMLYIDIDFLQCILRTIRVLWANAWLLLCIQFSQVLYALHQPNV